MDRSFERILRSIYIIIIIEATFLEQTEEFRYSWIPYCSNYPTGYPLRAKGRDRSPSRRDLGTRNKRGRSGRGEGFEDSFLFFLFSFSWSPTQVRIIYATTSIKVGEGDGQGEIADTRICKTGWREGGGAAMAYTRPTICTVISMRRNSTWLAVTRCISVVARPICTR